MAGVGAGEWPAVTSKSWSQPVAGKGRTGGWVTVGLWVAPNEMLPAG